MSETNFGFDPEETDPLFEDLLDEEAEFEVIDQLFGVNDLGDDLGGGSEPVPITDDEYDFGLEESQHPCFRFPKLGLPDFGKLPRIVVRGPSCCGATGEPILSTIGRLGKNIADLLARLGPVGQEDKTHPRTKAGVSTAKTIVTVPADPQHISAEMVAIAPEIALDLLTDFVANTLISAATSLVNLFGFVNAVSEKADALGDAAAKAIGDQLAAIAAAAEGVANAQGSAMGKIGARGLAAANQAAAIGGVRQVPYGINSNSGRRPTLNVMTDAGVRSQWPVTGGPRASIKQYLTNGANIALDMAMAASGMCWAGSAMRVLANATGMLAQGLGRDSLGSQVDAMLRLSVFHPYNVAKGLRRLAHSWRHECSLKTQFDGSLFPPLPDLDKLAARLRAALDGSCSASMPGNLMYAAYGDDEPPAGSRIIQEVPVRVAANLGVPNSDVQLINHYVTDKDKKYNKLTSSLPGIYQSGDPVLAQMRLGLKTLQDVLVYVEGLTAAEMTLLERNKTQFGGPVMAFIKLVPTRKTAIGGDYTRITNAFMNNRMTNAQTSALMSLASAWDDLDVDLTVIENEQVRTIVSRIFSPRLATLGFNRLSEMLSNGQANLDKYGGHIGPEIAYAAANQAALTRCLIILNDEERSDEEAFSEAVEILVDASENNAELTFGGETSAYIDDVAEVGLELKENGGLRTPVQSMTTMSRAGLPHTIQAAKDFAENSHQIASMLNSMMAETRDVRAYEIGKAANEIKVSDKNSDTQAYVSGALARQKEATKTILTKSMVDMNAAAKAIATAQISEKPNNRQEFVERIIKENANALAFMTIDKTTGIKLNQVFEGVVNQSKFAFNQAGTSIANEAPVIRSTARTLINQGQMILNEGDVIDNRGRWMYSLIEQSIGFLTGDYHVAANNQLVQTAQKQDYFGQTGTNVSDLVKAVFSAGPGGASSQIQLDATGKVKVFALTEFSLMVGLCSIKVTPTRIDINPIIPAVVTPEPVLNKYTAAPTLEKVSDLAPAKLPQEAGVNPVPVAAPYKSPMSFNPLEG